jgi:hypothetical protein
MKSIILLTLLFSWHLKAQVITDAWLKQPMPGLKMSSAYMTITNNTDQDLILEKVTGPDAKFYEIHTHSKVKGVMKMRKIENLTILSGKRHTLKPMADHIMLLEMHKTPFTKKSSHITLHFRGNKKLKVELNIKK